MGTTAGGMMSPENTMTFAAFDHPSCRRCATNPTIAESSTMNVTETTVSKRLFLSAVTNMLSRYVSTSCTLPQILHCSRQGEVEIGGVRSRLHRGQDDEANGMRKTIASGDQRNSIDPVAADELHSWSSLRMKNRCIGYASRTTRKNNTTLPAVAKP